MSRSDFVLALLSAVGGWLGLSLVMANPMSVPAFILLFVGIIVFLLRVGARKDFAYALIGLFVGVVGRLIFHQSDPMVLSPVSLLAGLGIVWLAAKV